MSRWPAVKLGEVAAIDRVVILPSNVDRSTPYVGLENIRQGGELTNISTIGEAGVGSAKFRFDEGQVLFGKLRPNLAKIARPGFRGVCSTDILPISPGPNLDRGYLCRFLMDPKTVALATSRSVGANLPRLAPSELAKFEIPMAPLADQRRIARVLDCVDDLRAKRRQAIVILNEMAESLFVDLFGATGEVWPIKVIEDVCEVVVDCVNRTAPTVVHETWYKMIRTTNIKGGRVDLTSVRYVEKETFIRWNRRATPRMGDVLLTREAPVGEAGILSTDDRVFLGQRLMLYRPNPAIIISEYLLGALRGIYLRRQFDRLSAGSTVKHLSLPACRSFGIPTPPIKLQRHFERRVRRLRALQASHEAHLGELDALFDSLQYRAFRGEL